MEKDLKDTNKPINSAIPLQAQMDKAMIPKYAVERMGYTNPYSWQNDNTIDSLITYAQAGIRHGEEVLQALVNLKAGYKFYKNAKWIDTKMKLPHALLAGWNWDAVYDKSLHVIGANNLMEEIR